MRRLVGYAAYMFGSTSIASLITFVVSIIGFKMRDKDVVGVYMTYVLVYSTLKGFFIYGANQAIQKFIGDEKENQIHFAKMALVVFAALFAVFSVAGLFAGFFFRWSLGFALLVVPWHVVWFWGMYLVRSNLDAKREARLLIVTSLCTSVFQLMFLTLTDFEDALIYGDALAIFAGGVAAIITIPVGLGLSFKSILSVRVPKELMRESTSFSAPLWLAGLIFDASNSLSGFWTRGYLGTGAMGAYGAMNQLWQFQAKPATFLTQAILPGLVQERDNSERDKLYRELVRVSVLSLPVIAVAVAGSMPLLLMIVGLGEKYAEIPLLLLLMSLTVPVRGVQLVLNQYAIAEGRPRLTFWSHLIEVVTLAIVLYPLTVAWGLNGVVVSGTIAITVATLYLVSGMKDAYKNSMRTTLWFGGAAVFSTILALVPIYLFRDATWNFLTAIPACAIYFGSMFAFGVLRLDDFLRVKRAYQARRMAAEKS